jgi:hypothetical protein
MARCSIQLYPDDMGALINTACLHLKRKDKGGALTVLERVLTRGTYRLRARSALRRVSP